MTDWSVFAACAGTDTEFFFDGVNSSVARKFCRTRCPVRGACLDDALRVEGTRGVHDRYGVVGGEFPASRWRIAQRRAA